MVMMIKLSLVKGKSLLKAAGYTVQEEEMIYSATLQDVIDNPRWYLDNLEYLSEYRVLWKDYKFLTPTLPHKFSKNGNIYK